MKCDFCGIDERQPYACGQCYRAFCQAHSQSDAHGCKPIKTQPAGHGIEILETHQKVGETSREEFKNIAIAWAALGAAFGVVMFGRANILMGVAISLVAVGAGFVLHELAHKFVGQKFGCWAEFRMWPQGLMLVLGLAAMSLFSGIPLPLFAAPGATYINGLLTKRQNGLVSLAGPLTNVAIAFAFLPLSLFGGIVGLIGTTGFSINAFLALFNMIPLGPLDGKKVLAWNKLVWAAVFVPLLLRLIISFV